MSSESECSDSEYLSVSSDEDKTQSNNLDLTGKIILTKTYTDSQLINLKLDEPTGVYLLIVESAEKKAVIKLVKE